VRSSAFTVGSAATTTGAGGVGQSVGGAGSVGATTSTGNVGQTVDRHLFCNTGMITRICHGNTGMNHNCFFQYGCSSNAYAASLRNTVSITETVLTSHSFLLCT
jgi:hypothetical protein